MHSTQIILVEFQNLYRFSQGTETLIRFFFFFFFFTDDTSNDIPSGKHTYIILTPIKPHFYIVKLGFTGVYIISLISVKKHIVGTR